MTIDSFRCRPKHAHQITGSLPGKLRAHNFYMDAHSTLWKECESLADNVSIEGFTNVEL